MGEYPDQIKPRFYLYFFPHKPMVNNITYKVRKYKETQKMVNRKLSSINQTAFTCSKLTTETREQGLKYVQS